MRLFSGKGGYLKGICQVPHKNFRAVFPKEYHVVYIQTVANRSGIFKLGKLGMIMFIKLNLIDLWCQWYFSSWVLGKPNKDGFGNIS